MKIRHTTFWIFTQPHPTANIKRSTPHIWISNYAWHGALEKLTLIVTRRSISNFRKIVYIKNKNQDVQCIYELYSNINICWDCAYWAVLARQRCLCSSLKYQHTNTTTSFYHQNKLSVISVAFHFKVVPLSPVNGNLSIIIKTLKASW